jgi:hypothetical protein
VALLVVLFLVLRGRGDGEPTAGTTARTTAAATTAAPTVVIEVARRVEVDVRGGRVAGGVRTVEVEKGERLLVVVRADVSDEVHVHGYDVSRVVAPGTPARIPLRATIAGRFEVELEDRKLRILELEVRP